MSAVFVKGYGAVSPAGWGVASLRNAIQRGQPLATIDLQPFAPGRPLRARAVPPCSPKPSFLAHPRLRRTSPIAQYAVAAALEALGDDARGFTHDSLHLGIIYCAMAGCVKYSQRFYAETLKEPATASPLVFPETVFNAPASHLAAFLGTTTINYTLVGDPGTFIQALALAADWLSSGRVAACLVIGAEELDRLVAEAFCLFDPAAVVSEGAGALYLTSQPGTPRGVELHAITDPQLYLPNQSRAQAARRVRAELNNCSDGLLCDGCQGLARLDRNESSAWSDWAGPRLSPKRICGEAFMAAAAWQCISAVDAVAQQTCSSATVSVVGCDEQAIAAQFGLADSHYQHSSV